jgi:hypothetical protein
MDSSSFFAKLSKALLYSSAITLLIVLVVASFSPGCTNVDTIDMWGQAHSRIYHDWHSVALTIIMTYLIRIYDGLQPVLVLQTLLFATGILLTIKKYSTPLIGIFLLLAFSLAPPIFFWLGFVGVDSFMACSLIFAIGAIYRYKESGAWPFLWLGLIGLYFGVATRHNGVFAVPFLLAWLFLRRPWFRSWLKIALVLLVFVGFLKVTDAAFRVRHEYPEQAGFLYDLAALSVKSGTMMVPPEFQKPGISLPMVQKALDPFNDGWLFWGPDSVIRLTESPQDMRDLESTWMKAVVTHPVEYLAWRSRYFARYAGIDTMELEPIIESCIVPNEQGLVAVQSRLHRWIMDHLKRIDQSILFRPYFYLSILLIFLVQGLWLKRWDTVWIAFAGIGYSLGYFIFGQSGNFRLAVFTNFTAVLLIVRLIAERVSEARAKSDTHARISPAWYVVASVLMIVAMVKIIHLARSPEAVLAGKAVFSNADFESGSVAPWQAYEDVHASVTSDQRHAGKYGLAESDNPGSVYQDITGLDPGKRYRIGAWVSASPGATAPAQIAVWDPVTNIIAYSGTITANSTWQPIELATTASASGTLRIHLFREQGSGTVYWDDVHIAEER